MIDQHEPARRLEKLRRRTRAARGGKLEQNRSLVRDLGEVRRKRLTELEEILCRYASADVFESTVLTDTLADLAMLSAARGLEFEWHVQHALWHAGCDLLTRNVESLRPTLSMTTTT